MWIGPGCRNLNHIVALVVRHSLQAGRRVQSRTHPGCCSRSGRRSHVAVAEAGCSLGHHIADSVASTDRCRSLLVGLRIEARVGLVHRTGCCSRRVPTWCAKLQMSSAG